MFTRAKVRIIYYISCNPLHQICQKHEKSFCAVLYVYAIIAEFLFFDSLEQRRDCSRGAWML